MDSGGKRASVIVTVERIKKSAVFAYKSDFCRCRTGINSKVTVSTVGSKVSGFHVVTVVAGKEGLVFFLTGKQRFHTCNFKFHMNFRGKFV